MKKALLTWIVISMLITSAGLAAGQAPPRGFDTPTQCAEAVFSALQSQDMAAIEECFAIPEMARLFDFRKYVERINAIPGQYSYLPGTSELGIAYNEASIRSMLYRQLAFSSVMLADSKYGEMINSYMTISPLDDKAYALISFLEAPSSLDGFGLLSLQFVITPALFPNIKDVYYSEKNTVNRARQMAIWNVEDDQELIIVAKMRDDTPGSGMAYIPLRYVQIGGKWLADPTGSNVRSLLGLPIYSIIGVMPAIP